MPEIHIEIRCDGHGFPSASELAKRHELEDALLADAIGDIVDAGGGMGVMDIYIDVEDVPGALSQIKAVVTRLGLADRTAVEPRPMRRD